MMWAVLTLLAVAAAIGPAAAMFPFSRDNDDDSDETQHHHRKHHHHHHHHKSSEDEDLFKLYPNKMNNKTYDYIIVGAGASGAVVASRLSEDPTVTVLLLEAGGTPNSLSEIPLRQPELLLNKSTEWNIYSEPQVDACRGQTNSQILLKRYKALGGCSTHNSQIYTRGNRKDYDGWAQLGCSDWNWNNVLEYFKKSEDSKLTKSDKNKHGYGGLLTISSLTYKSPLYESYNDAADEMGMPKEVDYNGKSQFGFGEIQATARDGRRCSTEKAFLRPAMKRKHNKLDVLTYAYANRVIIDENKKATGVEFKWKGEIRVVSAKREVILSAGALKTPQILMLSGIGPEDHLKEHGITVVHNSPGVGKNLNDHIMAAGQIWKFNESVTIISSKYVNDNASKEEFKKGTGPLTSPATFENMIFINTKFQNASEDYPDVQIEACASICITPLKKYDNDNVIEIFPAVCRPEGRGFVKLRSANPEDNPLVDPMYLSKPQDLKVLIEGMKFVRKIFEAESFKKYDPQPVKDHLQNCEGKYEWDSDEYLECHAREWTQTDFHYSGTCKMGIDKDAVVDCELRVIGIKNLRVVDASIMPYVPSANTNAPCIMIGEKGADYIKNANK